MNTSLTTIKLYGDLAEKYGREVKLAVSSITEAVKALSVNFPGFKKEVYDGHYHIFLDNLNVEQHELVNPIGKDKVIKIVPIVAGSGGFFKAIAGAALIALAIYFPPLAGASEGFLAAAAAGMKAIGTSLLFGGISQIFFSPPSQNTTDYERPENKPNFAFQGPVNTVTQGGAVPVAYGRLIVGSAVISAGISTSQR